MARPTFGSAPTIDEVVAAGGPLDQATFLANMARQMGTLPPPHARLWREVLGVLIEAGHTVTELAGRLDRSVGRISQLAGPGRTKPGPVRTKPNPAPTCAAPTVSPPSPGSLVSSQYDKTAAGADLHATVATADRTGATQ